jgi:hypothetical protein
LVSVVGVIAAGVPNLLTNAERIANAITDQYSKALALSGLAQALAATSR